MRERPRVDLIITLSETLRDLAADVELDIQAFCETALNAEVTRLWREQNRESIEAWNAWVDKHGLLLGKYRQF
jgi:antitoxin CcdA